MFFCTPGALSPALTSKKKCMTEMRLLLNFISQMLCSCAKTPHITTSDANVSCSLCGLCTECGGKVELAWGNAAFFLKSGQSTSPPVPKRAAGGEVLNPNQHILDTFISCCGPDPLAGLGLFLMNSDCQQKQNSYYGPRLVSSAGGEHRPGVSPEGTPDWTPQIQRKFLKRKREIAN